MKKCFQPESAGLPHLKKLGSNKKFRGFIQEQDQLNAPNEATETSARFLSQNFSQNDSKYEEVMPESIGTLDQGLKQEIEKNYQVARNVAIDAESIDY